MTMASSHATHEIAVLRAPCRDRRLPPGDPHAGLRLGHVQVPRLAGGAVGGVRELM
jgi:hypothetical protein